MKTNQVIRGGDGNAGFAVRDPNGQLVKAYEWLPSSDYSAPTAIEGHYAVCLDNQFSRFASKLVNIYMTVIKYDEWQRYAQELEGLQLNIQNFTVRIQLVVVFIFFFYRSLKLIVSLDLYTFQSSIGMVERNINGMLQFQAHSRSSEARDYALLVDNNKYVQHWSLAQIAVIMVTCSVQVCILKSHICVHSLKKYTNIICLFAFINCALFHSTGVFREEVIRYKYRWLSTCLIINRNKKYSD